VSAELADPGELYRLRRSVHGFVSCYGRFFWEMRRQHGQEPYVPPALDLLPAHHRPKALARDEARRLARSRLYCLDAAATDLAVRLGAAIRTAGHPAAVRTAGHPGVIASMNIAPPAPCGFLRWASGVAYAFEGGAPVIACHWGALPEGNWVAWWADNQITAHNVPAYLRQQYLAFTGPLFYEHSMLIRPAREPGTPLPAPPPGAADPRDADASDDAARMYTLLGSWMLLAVPGLITLTRHEPASAETTADRRAGISPGPLTCGTGPGSAQLTALIHAPGSGSSA
jgi:hypothetical protein